MASILQVPQTIACKVHPVDQFLSPAPGHRVDVTPDPYGWIIEDTGNGYAIIDRGTNYALGIPDESKTPGTNAILSVYDKGNVFQLWRIMTVMGPRLVALHYFTHTQADHPLIVARSSMSVPTWC